MSTPNEPNSPLDPGVLRAALEEAGNPWESAPTSMFVLDEDQRVSRLGVPARPELQTPCDRSHVATTLRISSSGGILKR